MSWCFISHTCIRWKMFDGYFCIHILKTFFDEYYSYLVKDLNLNIIQTWSSRPYSLTSVPKQQIQSDKILCLELERLSWSEFRLGRTWAEPIYLAIGYSPQGFFHHHIDSYKMTSFYLLLEWYHSRATAKQCIQWLAYTITYILLFFWTTST